MSWRSASLWLTAVCGLLAGLANGLMAMRVHVVAAAWVACGMTKREHMKASRRELAWRVSVRVPCADAWLRSTLCACAAGRPGLGLVRVGHRSSSRNLGGQSGRRSSAMPTAISKLLQLPRRCDGLALADRRAQPPQSRCLMRYSLPDSNPTGNLLLEGHITSNRARVCAASACRAHSRPRQECAARVPIVSPFVDACLLQTCGALVHRCVSLGVKIEHVSRCGHEQVGVLIERSRLTVRRRMDRTVKWARGGSRRAVMRWSDVTWSARGWVGVPKSRRAARRISVWMSRRGDGSECNLVGFSRGSVCTELVGCGREMWTGRQQMGRCKRMDQRADGSGYGLVGTRMGRGTRMSELTRQQRPRQPPWRLQL